jgi:putative transposase
MDAFSRYIVGYSVSSRLTTEQTTLPALQMLLRYRRGKLKPGIIFHSDGGGHYYDKEFIALTKKYKFKNSMCEYAYETGKAERINGIIKNNYLKHQEIRNLDQLQKALDRSVSLYNKERPHKNLKYKNTQRDRK